MTESNKEMSIAELIGENLNCVDSTQSIESKLPITSELVELDINEIKPYVAKPDIVAQNVDALLDNVDLAIEKRKQRDETFINNAIIDMKEKELEKNIESEDSNVSDFISDDDKFEDLKDSQANTEADDKEQLDAIKLTIKEKIKPIANIVDLKSFTISKKHVSVTRTLADSNHDKHIADWALISGRKPISMSELAGYEIEKLNPGSSSRNRYNTYMDIYTIIYDHIIDDNKPPLDIWLKGISFYDIPHIYFTAYKSCFEGSNSIPYACGKPECKHVFMNDYEIKQMVKYKNDTIKKLVEDILTNNTNSENPDDYEAELVQVSDNYVFAFREPTIWNIIFENAVLDEKFTDKYSDFLAIMTYIDCVYYINRETNQLEPIQVEDDINNVLKTVKSRVVKYSEVFKSLSSDQFQFLQAYIKKINDRHDEISYILPEATCPKCKTVIKEQVMEPDQLLFTRHQLAAIANI